MRWRACTSRSVVRYCTPECQKEDWQTHEPDCGGRKTACETCECRSCVSNRGERSAAMPV